MNRKTIISMFVFFALVSISSAQDRIVVTPFVETGSVSRSFTYADQSSGYKQTGLQSTTVQKGFGLEFRGDHSLTTKFRFSTGTVGTPTRHRLFTDDTTDEEVYSNSTNATVVYKGRSRMFEISQEYTRGVVTFRGGVVYRLLEHTDFQTTFDGFGHSFYTESEFTDTFAGPRFGISANPKFWRVTGNLSVDVAPWLHHGGYYQFRQENWGDSTYKGASSSKSMDLELGGSVRFIRNFGVSAGWRYSAIHTGDANFYLAKPMGNMTKIPQRDSWKGFYLGVTTRF